ASAVHLRAIKGIGPSRAEEIVRYRSKKGAFTSVDELYQVPHVGDMPSQELEQVKRLFTVSTTDDQAASGQRSEKVNINRANAATLPQIRGIGEAQPQAAGQYRQERGPIRDLSELELIPQLRERSSLERQRINSALEV